MPTCEEEEVTYKNLSLRQIRKFWNWGKPLYLEQEDRNARIFGIRVRKGIFEAKLQVDGGFKWKTAQTDKVICAY